jgi:hypothetical protein
MKNQMIKMAMMIVWAAGLMTAAVSAQNEIGDDLAKGFIYDGVETSAGNQDPVSGFQYSNTYVLTSLREGESRYMTVSVNSREMFKGVGVTGGAWSVAVFRDGAYVGTVYGEVVSGDIQNIVSKKGYVVGKQTRVDLQGTGGTGIFDNEESQKINGSLIMSTELLTKKKITIAFETLNF